MMEVIAGQGRLSCSDARLLLEMTVAEEFLSDEERHLLDAHLSECGRCRNLHKLTVGLQLFAKAGDSELDARISAVTEGLRRKRAAAKRRKTRWAAAAVAAAAAAALAVISVGRRPTVESPGLVGTPVVALRCAAGALTTPATGVWVTQCKGTALQTVIADGAVRVVLKDGAVALYVDPARPDKRRVEVETPLGTVRVKGTLFAVQVDNDDAHVQVYRGVVEVIPSAHETYAVSQGRGASLKHRTMYACAAPSDDALVHALSAHYALTGARATDDIPVVTPTAESSVSKPSPPADDAGASAVGNAEIAAESGELLRREGRHSVADTRRIVSMDALIQDAQSCLLLRDWECAASRYREVLDRYSRRPESTAVLISLAKIEMRHLRLPDKALGHYRDYLVRLPTGPLAEEALIGTAEAYRRMGLKARERETLQGFLLRFPQSALSGKAQSRLNQLNNASSL